ncbi:MULTISPECIES: lipopolysaccharide kinase InaA family protein [unclassified Pseudomonas]|uniref:lipopolysaccharide kinase InaA family protein n=1 Tax=unclassified Pseudomonas TaxID=196821 RepID=UPI000BCFE561|nr:MULTISPECIES: lipopolysaccharide kinase InaA family protein [unclassified Pseudomonas]PVZ15605.1 lipopolysaccharide kinase (Kdo/WaaP) family protein [Pseudomonas sp. URIL14HWK12:I12]PVZ24979.1 lipopolysaccharide kinase (Kdo/WaaP) family protein [Pseudomonas sp. URIL14HWK12:I10]PVZ34825.1 lipopolysaccharide kinase (Kdo/WaaP) family protein [Pseudomonas sp. URIL14HWK12:I11]SNZ09384.1 Lipopolysaccharide kinase (Kdo/WaaP) family protein [Pseudomonas sp. URIL14HWK12:I9]
MNTFNGADAQALLARHGLDSFQALWNLQLTAVDEPNTGRGGWSSVYRLELEGQGFFLKRQSGYLTRTLRRPFGEPTFAREFRNIQRYRRMGIPSLDAVFYGQHQAAEGTQAVLLTRALDDWADLESWNDRWAEVPPEGRQAILAAVGGLARTLHGAGQVHNCFYPKHVFLREKAGQFQACLIDLEKTRPLIFGRRDRVRDLEPLLRRSHMWSDDEIRLMLAAYLKQPAEGAEVGAWLEQLGRRRRHKGNR